jgi:DNA-binding MarR family transcriptional regulator
VDNLKLEIAQEAPFHSVEEQALLNLIRTADRLDRRLQQKIKPWGVTATQYNVLRILRGAHPQGLTCSAIGDRMLTAEPDITRLLSRLKALKLIRQHRDRNDRRVLWTQISETGLTLLSDMDPMIQKMPIELLGHLGNADLVELIRLLEIARKSCEERGAQPACNGNSEDGDGSEQVGGRVDCDGKSGQVTCDGKARPVTCDGQGR